MLTRFGKLFLRKSHLLKEVWRPKDGLKSNTATFKTLFPKNATLKRVSTGFLFTEGPVWFQESDFLLFSDIPGNRIYKLTIDGHLSTFRTPSSHSNGLTRDRQGRLIACEHGSRCVTRTEYDGAINPLACQFEGKRLNSPNDVVVKSDGAVYFTDPPYGIRPEMQEQHRQGVYRISPDRSESTLVADDFEKPNGLAFSPDERHLYVDDSEARHIRIFDVGGDGRLLNSRLFIDMKSIQPGLPDGMKVDVVGHIFCTGPGGVWVINPSGRHLGTIKIPEIASNCAWGGRDWKSLYITATTSVYMIRLNCPGSVK